MVTYFGADRWSEKAFKMTSSPDQKSQMRKSHEHNPIYLNRWKTYQMLK